MAWRVYTDSQSSGIHKLGGAISFKKEVQGQATAYYLEQDSVLPTGLPSFLDGQVNITRVTFRGVAGQEVSAKIQYGLYRLSRNTHADVTDTDSGFGANIKLSAEDIDSAQDLMIEILNGKTDHLVVPYSEPG